LKKTPPEETPIVSRVADGGAGASGSRDSRDILELIDRALDEHAVWLRKWHRAIVCGLPPADDVMAPAGSGLYGGRGLLDQPAFRQLRSIYEDMQRMGSDLARRAAVGERIPARDYDAFDGKSLEFTATARRIRDAFQTAASDLDPLTGVHNRRGMITALSRERERSIRTGKAMCVGLCDIDTFKAVNDRHGHLVGDAVLLAVAGRLIANLRPYDAIYRFGGDEFLVAFFETAADQAVGIADRLRESLSHMTVQVGDGLDISVTASFGLCMVDASAPLESTIQHADEALYRAKRDGRNRVVLWQPDGVAGGGGA
jgi:diguanylate cyclase (GGDEF)-like protein